MIWNLGSINADNFYEVARLPGPGETVSARGVRQGLGGKGANMSVAAARAAARTAHIGAVGSDGRWAKDRLLEYGVDPGHVALVQGPTGHANIHVDDLGENAIVVFPGANHEITDEMIGAALAEASPRDWLLMQNETNGQQFAAQTARTLGLSVAYAAAPFDADAVKAVRPLIDLLVLNEVEARQLEAAMNTSMDALAVPNVVVTKGADGCDWFANQTGKSQNFPAFETDVVDTTGAGDTFTGYLVAGLDRGMPMVPAIKLAQQAASLMVARHGTADVIPDLKEIQDQFGI